MSPEHIQQLASVDMSAVDATIRERLTSDVALVNQLGHYIIAAGGKRIRPMLTTLAARACGSKGVASPRTDLILAAVVVEFIHTATLLHDDVVDASELRRGQPTANQTFGNEAAVLVGDFLYSRAFELMVEIDRMEVLRVLAHATNVIAEGEVQQLMNVHDPDVDEARYLGVIESKTAKLFEAACEIGAILNDRPPSEREALACFGRHLGTAFQLIDDLLDYAADPTETGKNLGDDLAEGKPTLPLILAMARGTDAERDAIRRAIEEGGREHTATVLAAVKRTETLDLVRERAIEQSRLACEALEEYITPSPQRDALIALATHAAHRRA
ncbi:MAG: polyprenyl synthetase family protein [Thioalkalivibrionaceae bacterium]